MTPRPGSTARPLRKLSFCIESALDPAARERRRIQQLAQFRRAQAAVLKRHVEHRPPFPVGALGDRGGLLVADRSEEHTSELQSLMRISYAVFCLKKKKKQNTRQNSHI